MWAYIHTKSQQSLQEGTYLRLSKALYSNPKPTGCTMQPVGTSPTLAEIGIDKMLAQMPKQDGGDAKRNSLGCTMQPSESPPTLAEIGIEKTQAHRWQQIASLTDEVFEEHITDTKSDGKELTTASILRVAREHNKDTSPPILQDGKYRVIYADPPWKYGNTMPDYMGVQDDHYRLMSIQEICSMPVKNIAEDNAVLFLWVTSPILEESFGVIKAWGFEYKSSFVWDKVKHNMGHYNSVRHELLLVCTRGSCQPDVHKLFDSVITEERTEHSKKPDTFRTIIDTIYTSGKRIELFAREAHNGWDNYGNEI